MRRAAFRVFAAAGVMLLSAGLLSGCQTTTVEQQTKALTLAPESLGDRQTQSRRFDTADEAFVLAGCAGVLQDLGFSIEESSVKSGLIVASKDRDAIEAGQVAGQMFMASLVTLMGGRADPVWDKDQRIRISIVTVPQGERGIMVRTTFQRVVRNTKNMISKVETINDPLIHQEFFDRLSQSMFLEAHQV